MCVCVSVMITFSLVHVNSDQLARLSLLDEAAHEALIHQPLLDGQIVDRQQVECGAQLLLALAQQLTLIARVDGEGSE